MCKYRASLAQAGTESHVDIPRGDIQSLEDAVSSIGPISVAMDAGHKSFQVSQLAMLTKCFYMINAC